MLKILSTQQIRDLDAYTIQHRPIASIDLMENACHAIVAWFTQQYDATHAVGIVCGTGNNGGDGLGVARLLAEAGYTVRVWVVKGGVAESDDFKKNLARLVDKVTVTTLVKEVTTDIFSECDILIDALFGSGLSRKPEGIYASTINCLNETTVDKIAVDIPSGLMADKPSEGPIVKAKFTLAFQVPKLAFLFPQHFIYVGTWVLLEIGLHKDFLKTVDTSYYYVVRTDARKILHQRSKFDHKGKYGHALLIAGGHGKMGAAVLAARSTLRTGPGLLTVHIPRMGYPIIQQSVPEAMASVDVDDEVFSTLPNLDPYNVIGIGPGLGQLQKSVNAFAEILRHCKVPMVIDADALNMLAANRELLPLVPRESILTPHPKEFERLVGPWKNDFERLEKQKRLAKDLQSVIVLKGANTSIASPDGNVFFNSSGNPGMAKGGTGDVLTGILTGLRAQNYASVDAARLGVFLHGLAGDLAVYDKGMNSVIASDLVDFLPEAFKTVG